MNHTWKRPTSSERAIANSNFFSSNMSSWLGKLLLASSLYIELRRRPAPDDLSIIVCGVGAAGTTAEKMLCFTLHHMTHHKADHSKGT